MCIMIILNEELIDKVYRAFCRLQKIDDSKILTDNDKEVISKALDEQISAYDMLDLVKSL